MAYGDFKDLNRRTTADKVLHDKASSRTAKNEIISNKELAEELH